MLNLSIFWLMRAAYLPSKYNKKVCHCSTIHLNSWKFSIWFCISTSKGISKWFRRTAWIFNEFVSTKGTLLNRYIFSLIFFLPLIFIFQNKKNKLLPPFARKWRHQLAWEVTISFCETFFVWYKFFELLAQS